MTPPRQVADAEQLAFLRQLADAWRASGKWPTLKRYRTLHQKEGRSFDEFRMRLPYDLSAVTADDRIRLTIVGLEVADEAAREIATFLELLRRAVARFVDQPLGDNAVRPADLRDILGDTSDFSAGLRVIHLAAG